MTRVARAALMVAVAGCGGEVASPSRVEARVQGIDIGIDERGAELSDTPWRARVTLAAIGREGALVDPGAAVLGGEGLRTTLARAGVVEWYVVDGARLEHGFDVATRSPGDGPLWITLDLDGLAADGSGGHLLLRDGEGHVRLHYSHPSSVDARGRALRTRLTGLGATVRIEVDDEHAVYPIVVDPFFWTDLGLLVSSDAAADQQCGSSVAFDGTTALVGCRDDDTVGSFAGSAGFFVRDADGAWVESQRVMAEAAYDMFGTTVAIDGDAALVAAPGAQSHDGVVYAYRRSGSAWSNEFALTIPGSAFLTAMALDGDRALVGSGQAAQVFARASDGAWYVEATLTPSPVVSLAGESVALQGDTALLGGYEDDTLGMRAGTAFVFRRDANGVWQQEAQLFASDGQAWDYFGGFMDVEGDTAAIGARLITSNGDGAVYIFHRQPDGSWSEDQKLVASDSAGFSGRVSVHGNRLAVGAYADDDGGNDAGAAYVFLLQPDGSYLEETKLHAADAAPEAIFGWSVDVHDNVVVTGAPMASGMGAVAGAAYAHAFVGDNGEVCTVDAECESYHCVNGICCNSACDGACAACDLAGTLGTCTPLADGTSCDDGDECTGEDVCAAGSCEAGEPICGEGGGGAGGSGGSAPPADDDDKRTVSDGGCGCRTEGRAPASPAWLLCAALLLWRRQLRARRAAPGRS